MNKKKILDVTIIFSCGIAFILCYCYTENEYIRNCLLTILAVIFLFFTGLFLKDRKSNQEYGITQDKSITQIVLLNEEEEQAATWDIFGKVSIVLGKQGRDNQVDVDLRNTACAGTVDMEHAVINYYSGGWYIEDLDSENGVKIQKFTDGETYRVSSKEPCKIEKYDKIYLGLTKLKVQ